MLGGAGRARTANQISGKMFILIPLKAAALIGPSHKTCGELLQLQKKLVEFAKGCSQRCLEKPGSLQKSSKQVCSEANNYQSEIEEKRGLLCDTGGLDMPRNRAASVLNAS